MYKAKIVTVSALDGNGDIEISYDIYVDDVLTYPSKRYYGAPDQFEDQTKTEMSRIKAQYEQSLAIQIGDEIELNG